MQRTSGLGSTCLYVVLGRTCLLCLKELIFLIGLEALLCLLCSKALICLLWLDTVTRLFCLVAHICLLCLEAIICLLDLKSDICLMCLEALHVCCAWMWWEKGTSCTSTVLRGGACETPYSNTIPHTGICTVQFELFLCSDIGTVKFALFLAVWYTQYSVHCSSQRNVQCTVYTVPCTEMCTVQFTVYTVPCTVYSLQSKVLDSRLPSSRHLAARALERSHDVRPAQRFTSLMSAVVQCSEAL